MEPGRSGRGGGSSGGGSASRQVEHPRSRTPPAQRPGTAQIMATPPFGRTTWPVMNREASEAR